MYDAATVIEQFNAEAGDIYTLVPDATKVMWFNQGQNRLPLAYESSADIDWVAADTEVDLPEDFIALRKILPHPDNDSCDQWRVLGFGRTLTIADGKRTFDGAARAGSAVIRYQAEWPDVSDDQSSLLPKKADVACVYYSLHRFYRFLGSNRSAYKRYSTLTGANAVSMSDLQGEADRYLQDFTDAAGELGLGQPVSYYGG